MEKYIKVEGNKVFLGGLVATEEMLKDGWFLYDGDIPNSEFLKWEDGKIVVDSDAEKEFLNGLKKEKIKEIKQSFQKAIEQFTKPYPEEEKLSWDKQEEEARAYKKDNTVSTPLIDKIAETRGIEKDVLVDKIVKKADVYALMIGEAIGKRQALEDKINNATTIEEIEAVKWED